MRTFDMRAVAGAAVQIFLVSLLTWPAAGAAEPAKRLYSFTQQMGFVAGGSLVFDRHGVMYGTSSEGGAAGEGTVFKFDPKTGAFTIIYSFLGGADGSAPASGVVLTKSGLLYGVTQAGGASNLGTVFKVDPATGVESVLHSFGAGKDGAQPPVAGPVLGADGLLYGTTMAGGNAGGGTIYSVAPSSGREKIVLNFDAALGTVPYGVVADSSGVLYGMTTQGGLNNGGSVFEFDPATGTETDLLDFGNGYGPGQLPIPGGDGFLYGVANHSGSGVAYSIDIATKGFAPIYDFGYYAGPSFRMVMGLDGMLYGTTRPTYQPDDGVVFELNPSTGAESILHTFNGRVNGGEPFGLVFGKNGRLYGVNDIGGASYHGPKNPGYGTIFSINP